MNAMISWTVSPSSSVMRGWRASGSAIRLTTTARASRASRAAFTVCRCSACSSLVAAPASTGMVISVITLSVLYTTSWSVW